MSVVRRWRGLRPMASPKWWRQRRRTDCEATKRSDELAEMHTAALLMMKVATLLTLWLLLLLLLRVPERYRLCSSLPEAKRSC